MDYDADGNLIRKYNASGFDQTLTWNALGQLTGVMRVGVGSVTYGYDGYGRRVKRTDAAGAVTHFIYDGDDLALEVDGAGNLLREYTYYPGIDQPHGMRQWAGGAGGASYYYVLQQPGHVKGLVNLNDQLVNEYRYTLFGMPVNGFPVQGTANPLQYMAREVDAATGLYYVRNRWYDPQMGRFVSEDPIGLAGGINQYAYVGNNPLSFRDPTGLSPCDNPATPVVELCPLVVTAAPRLPMVIWLGNWFRGWNNVSAWTFAWLVGAGPVNRDVQGASIHNANLRKSPGVQAAMDAFCDKNPNGVAENPVTNWGYRFNTPGRVLGAGLNPTLQFVGSYTVDVFPILAGPTAGRAAVVIVYNTTRFDSAAYQITDYSWERENGMNPMSNVGQTFGWTESMTKMCGAAAP